MSDEPTRMTHTGDNPGWDDPEDTLPPYPEEPEHYGPDIPSQGGDFRFSQTAGEAWADPDGVEVSLLSPRSGAARFHLDRPLVVRLRNSLETALVAHHRAILSPASRPPQLPKCPHPPDDFVLSFTVGDEPQLTMSKHGGACDHWLYVSLRSHRASLGLHLEDAVAFHLHEWLSDAERTPSASRRALGRAFCELDWPVCPTCLGESLNCSGGLGSCPGCGGQWLAVSDSCGRPATHQLIDASAGERFLICSSHAQAARRDLTDVVVEPISAICSPMASDLV